MAVLQKSLRTGCGFKKIMLLQGRGVDRSKTNAKLRPATWELWRQVGWLVVR